jgi:hypothetical protein
MNSNRAFVRCIAALILVGAASTIGVLFSAEHATIPNPAIQSEARGQVIDRSKKADALGTPRSIAPARSNHIEPPIRSVTTAID